MAPANLLLIYIHNNGFWCDWRTQIAAETVAIPSFRFIEQFPVESCGGCCPYMGQVMLSALTKCKMIRYNLAESYIWTIWNFHFPLIGISHAATQSKQNPCTPHTVQVIRYKLSMFFLRFWRAFVIFFCSLSKHSSQSGAYGRALAAEIDWLIFHVGKWLVLSRLELGNALSLDAEFPWWLPLRKPNTQIVHNCTPKPVDSIIKFTWKWCAVHLWVARGKRISCLFSISHSRWMSTLPLY